MDEVTAAREQVSADLRQGGLLSQKLPGYEEREAQIAMAEAVATALATGQHTLIEAGTGTGKALDVNTLIPTPNGWKRMGDLVIGDEVFDEMGRPTRVVAAFEIMDDRICYEITFSDGASMIADAEHEWISYTATDRKWAGRPRLLDPVDKNFATREYLQTLEQIMTDIQNSESLSVHEAEQLIGGHRWSVYQAAKSMSPINPEETPARFPGHMLLQQVHERLSQDLTGQRRDGRAYSIVTTRQMAASLRAAPNNRANHAIKIAHALELPEVDLPIDPYFLGAWLGDGSRYNNQITAADRDILTEIEKAGYTTRPIQSRLYQYAVDDEDGKGRNRWQPGMTGKLRSLGVLLNKHIPMAYLRASKEQRFALLAGLLDTDGTVNRSGAVEFTTTSPALAEGVYELITSLGFRASERTGRAKLNGKDCGPKWTLAFTTDKPVFRLRRKLATQQERLCNFTPERNCFRYVLDIREVPSRPVRCIQVDSPNHLYLASRAMIPTHNSIAYLLPIVRSGKKAIVATANKALQEQLYYKDLPFINSYIAPVDYALVKGMGNYLCRQHFEEERGFQQLVQQPAFTKLDHLLDKRSFDGDLDVVPFGIPGDLRGRVAADGDDCAWRACDHYNSCFVRQMRDRAQAAQIIIVNHTLLLIDTMMDGWLLPERDVVVVDEAHHLPDEATRSFTVTVSPRSVDSLLSLRQLREHCDPQKMEVAIGANAFVWARLEEVISFGSRNRVPFTGPLQEGLRLSSAIKEIGTSLRQRRPENMSEREEQLFDKLLRRVSNLAGDLALVFGESDADKFVYYVERVMSRRGRDPLTSISAAPLSVTELLRKNLFDKGSVIATSATLAINGSFAFYRRQIGLEDDALEFIFPSPFDFRTNARIFVPGPSDIPEPSYGSESHEYLDKLADLMARLVRASHGRAFLLFTSQRALSEVLHRFAETHKLEDEGFSLLVQGHDVGRKELLARFRVAEQAVLLGLRSFWEGVDVVGDTLSLVAIDKLPFAPPDDPVHEARVSRMRAAGENWFGDYVLPLAIMQLKQGVGRLIRSREDRGVIAILDSRLISKNYGRSVLLSLPDALRTRHMHTIEAFFAEKDGAEQP